MSFKVNPRESISRCEVYENKFRSYPDEARLKEARRLLANDTLDSESNQMERYLTDKFRQGMFNVDGNGIRYVKQVARFIFSSVTYPAYLVVYLIPKYVIQYALPFAVNFFGNFMNKFTAGASALIAWATQVSGILQEMFNKFFLNKLERLKNVFKTSKDFIKERFSRLSGGLRSLFHKLVAPVSRFAQGQKEKMKKRLSSWFAPVKRLIMKVMAYFPKFEIRKRVLFRDKLRHYLGTLNKKVQALLQKVRKKVLNLRDEFPNLVKKGLDQTKRTKKFLKYPKAIIWFFGEIVKTNYEIWIAPWVRRVIRLSRWIGSKFYVLKIRISASLQKAIKVFSPYVQTTLMFLKGIVLNLKQKGIQIVTPIPKAFQKLTSVFPKIPILTFPKITLPSLTLKKPGIIVVFEKGVLKVMNQLSRLGQKISKKLKSFSLVTKVFFKVLFEQLSN